VLLVLVRVFVLVVLLLVLVVLLLGLVVLLLGLVVLELLVLALALVRVVVRVLEEEEHFGALEALMKTDLSKSLMLFCATAERHPPHWMVLNQRSHPPIFYANCDAFWRLT